MLSTHKTPPTVWLADLVCLTFLVGFFYALWLGGHALFTPDEGRYSEIAREMVVTHDYITPRLNGVAFLDKPILYYWLQASAIKLFGLKEWALRFWPACFGVLGCLITYFAGHVLFNRRTGILSAVILATSPLYYGAAHYANLDLEMAVLISTTLLFSLLALHSPAKQKKTFYFILAYIFCALAILTKGLIGIVFPAMIIGLWIILLNQWRNLKQMYLITGLFIVIIITLPWYTLVQKANPEFLHFFFVTQQFSRFLAHGDFNNAMPSWFYLPVVLLGFFPWSVFMLQACTKNIKAILQARKAHSIELFLLLWPLLIFIFFSIPKSKLIGYILPIFPALALIIGRYLDDMWAKTLRYSTVIFMLLCVSLFFLCVFISFNQTLTIPPATFGYLKIAAAIFLVCAISSAILLKKNAAASKIIYNMLIFAVASLLTLAASLHTLTFNSIKPLALQLKPQLIFQDEVVTFYKYYQDLPLYLERRITIVTNWQAPEIVQRDNWTREFWFGMPFQDTHAWLIDEKIFWQRWNSDKHLLVLLDRNEYPEFLLKAKNSIQKIGLYQDVVWVSNN